MTDKIRCQIVDVAGAKLTDGQVAIETPSISKPHVGKYGYVEYGFSVVPRITLDDGTILWGHECWWIRVIEPAPTASEYAWW